MSVDFRKQAKYFDLSVVDHLLQRIKEIEKETGRSSTLFRCVSKLAGRDPCSIAAAKRNNAPIKFAATLIRLIYRTDIQDLINTNS